MYIGDPSYQASHVTKLLIHKIHCVTFDIAENIKIAKRFGSSQPARTAQVDMNRYFLQPVLDPPLHRQGSNFNRNVSVSN